MTATTSTMSGPVSARRGPALWAGLALFAGGVIGASASAVVIDSDSSPAESVVSVEGSFRSASAAEAERYVDSLEDRAIVPGVTEHGYAYAHGFSFSPETVSHMSADAIERWTLTEQSSSPMSPAAIEHRAEAQAQAQAEARASSLDSCHGATHGVC